MDQVLVFPWNQFHEFFLIQEFFNGNGNVYILGACISKPGCVAELRNSGKNSVICDGVVDCPVNKTDRLPV